jgi:hypothetical protein
MDPVVSEYCLASFLIGNEDELHMSLGKGEVRGRPVRLFLCRYKAHASHRDLKAG